MICLGRGLRSPSASSYHCASSLSPFSSSSQSLYYHLCESAVFFPSFEKWEKFSPKHFCKIKSLRLTLDTDSILTSSLSYSIFIDGVAQSVRIRTGSSILSTLPVEQLVKPEKRKSLALCLPRVYQKPYCADCQGFNYTYYLPEWMEMQRIMGVDTVFVYNVSMNADASLVFSHYARQGFVEILSHSPIHGESYMPVSMGVTECMLRNRFAYDYVLSIDMDEFIFSEKWNTYQEMIDALYSNGTHKHLHFDMGIF